MPKTSHATPQAIDQPGQGGLPCTDPARGQQSQKHQDRQGRDQRRNQPVSERIVTLNPHSPTVSP